MKQPLHGLPRRTRAEVGLQTLSAWSTALALLSLAGCSTPPPAPEAVLTLASLSSRVPPTNLAASDAGLDPTPEQVMAAYRRFIDVAVDVPQRAEALRRLGDLEMDAADRRAAAALEAQVPDYRAARERFEAFLQAYPKAPRADRVLYQLARAQEQAGELEAALQTLTRLVTEHPGTLHTAEAQFRRGEMLFATGQYAPAEAAYDAVLRFERRGLPAAEAASTPLLERALYMQGWSLFKLGRTEAALQAFFEVLDNKLAPLPPVPREELPLARISALSRADRELLADTLRVIGLGAGRLQGTATLARHIDGVAAPSASASRLRQGYQFRVYQALSDTQLQQGKPTEAAATLSRFLRLQHLHVQAPWLQAQVVRIAADEGQTAAALQARREHVQRYGAGPEAQAFQRAQPTAWRLAQPQVQAYLTELARHHHAQSQQASLTPARRAAEAAEGVRWYRELLAQFPAAGTDGARAASSPATELETQTVQAVQPEPAVQPVQSAAATRFLLAELLFESGRYAEAATEYETVAYTRTPATEKPLPDAQHARRAEAGYGALLAYAELERQAIVAKDAAPDPALQRRWQTQAVDSALRFAQAQPTDPRRPAVLLRAAQQLQQLGDGERASDVARQTLAALAPIAPGEAPATAEAAPLDAAPAAAPSSAVFSNSEIRRAAWQVLARQAEQSARHEEAEAVYAQVLSLLPGHAAASLATPATVPTPASVAERIATAIYRQGEAARTEGRGADAARHFERITHLAALPATAPVRATAQFDAATAFTALQAWPAAARLLEDFRREQGGHPLQAEVPAKLALVYEQLGRYSAAAAEFEMVAAQAQPRSELARSAWWRAAEMHTLAQRASPQPAQQTTQQTAQQPAPRQSPGQAQTPLTRSEAVIQAWQRYLQQFPLPLEPATEARWALAQAEAGGSLSMSASSSASTPSTAARQRATAWLRELQAAEAAGGDARTPRSRTLAGRAALALAEPAAAAYRAVPLVEPLARQLKLKKARLEDALKAYEAALEPGISEATTAATLGTARLYQDFARALLQSERPRQLNKAEREQYGVLLEEQAFPFEEKAIALLEANARRAAQGVYDAAVQASFTELALLKPARWAKNELGDSRLPQDLAAIDAAVDAAVKAAVEAPRAADLQSAANANIDTAALTPKAVWLNQRGIALRRLGRFTEARSAFEAALQADARLAAAQLNLAVLLDLYLADRTSATAQYQRYLELAPEDAARVNKWLAELKNRKDPA